MVLVQEVDALHNLPNEIACEKRGCIVGITTNENNIPIDEVISN